VTAIRCRTAPRRVGRACVPWVRSPRGRVGDVRGRGRRTPWR
jgi:hypothetical protein